MPKPHAVPAWCSIHFGINVLGAMEFYLSRNALAESAGDREIAGETFRHVAKVLADCRSVLTNFARHDEFSALLIQEINKLLEYPVGEPKPEEPK